MVAGRPRYTTPPPEECHELGRKLVKWASEPSPELRSRFCEWYTQEEIGMIASEWEALLKIAEFRGYYERAQAQLGRRYMDGTINPSVGHRVMWHYVPDSQTQEKEKMRYQAELARKTDKDEEDIQLTTEQMIDAIAEAKHKARAESRFSKSR